MSNLELGFWSFPVLLVLIFLRLPIGLAMLLMGLVGTWIVFGNAEDGSVVRVAVTTISSLSPCAAAAPIIASSETPPAKTLPLMNPTPDHFLILRIIRTYRRF